jgi:hypothetical protein
MWARWVAARRVSSHRQKVKTSSRVRARVARHLHQLVTLAATTTLTTTACACDMIPPPARVPLDPASMGSPTGQLLEEANMIYLDITIPNGSACNFDSNFGDVDGALVVKATGGPGMTLRLRPKDGVTHVSGTVVCARTDGSNAKAKIRVDADITPAQPLPSNVSVVLKTLSEDPPPGAP